jgi:hypothetical protein
MAPDVRSTDVMIDGRPMIPSLSFRSASSYVPVAAGQHTLAVTASGDPQRTLLNTSLSVDNGSNETVVIVGLTPELSALVLSPDDLQAPAPGKAKVRFVHAGADVPAVDIAVTGGPVLFQNVGFKGVSGPIEVDAGSYNLELRNAGGSSVLLAVPNVSLQAGQIVTVFGAGLRSDNTLTAVAVPYPVASAGTQASAAQVTSAPATPLGAQVPAAGSGGPAAGAVVPRLLLLISVFALLGSGLVAVRAWRGPES